MDSRRLFALPLLAVPMMWVSIPLMAQSAGEDRIPFYFNGHVWANKQAFIDHARCGTPRLTAEEADEVDAATARAMARSSTQALHEPVPTLS